MIPREDFALETEEFILNLFQDFPIANLSSDSPILRLLRKPDLQNEQIIGAHGTDSYFHSKFFG